MDFSRVKGNEEVIDPRLLRKNIEEEVKKGENKKFLYKVIVKVYNVP